MKMKLTGIALALLLVFSLCVPSFAAEELTATGSGVRYVVDFYGLLSADERTSLETQAAAVSEQYSCGVYIVTVDDYTNYGDGDVWSVTAYICDDLDLGFGAGDGGSGIVLLLSMNSRDYALYVRGERAEYAFNDYALGQLENAFLGDLGNDNWYGGFSAYLSACERYLASAREGNPAQAGYALPIVASVVISCIIALIICLILSSRMKTVHQKNDAREYVAASGLNLTRQVDKYTHSTETRRKIERGSESSRSGGSAGGGGHSGKF